MLIGKGGKAAGDFSLYADKCQLFTAGWKMFRPEVYEFNLVDEASPEPDSAQEALKDLNNLEECDKYLES